MKLTVETNILQDLVAKSIKGAGFNRLLPITSFMEIQYKDGRLSLQTTDSTNYLYVSSKTEFECDEPEFYVVVEADRFAKLVSKITTIRTEINVVNGVLKIRANGHYDLPLPLNELGELVRFPKFSVGECEQHHVSSYIFKTCLSALQSALSMSTDIPCYMNYYLDSEMVIATDTSVINALHKEDIFPHPVLISNTMMNLLGLIEDESVTIRYNNSKISFITSDVAVGGYLPEGIEDFQVDVIKNLIDYDFTHMIRLSKLELLQALDRLSLFTDKYDKNGVAFDVVVFEDSAKFVLNSFANDSTEMLETRGSVNAEEFHAALNIMNFLTQVKSLSTDDVELWYGPDNAVSLTDGNVVHIIALLTDEE